MSEGKRAQLLTGFRGAYLSSDGALYATFPKQQGNPGALVRLGLRQGDVKPMFELEEQKGNRKQSDSDEDAEAKQTRTLPPALVQIKASTMRQYGAFVLAGSSVNEKDSYKNIDFTAYDTTSGKQLWTRHFGKENPSYIVTDNDQTLVLQWAASEKTSQAEINADPALRAEFTSLHEKKGIVLLEIVALRDGKTLGKLLVDTGRNSFTLENVQAGGDYVVIDDDHNRTLVYRVSTGAQLGSVFGNRNALSAVSNLLLVENNPGEATLYSLPAMSKIQEFQFGSRLHFARFSPDGKRLFVLTEKQDAYLLDVSGGTEKAVVQGQ